MDVSRRERLIELASKIGEARQEREDAEALVRELRDAERALVAEFDGLIAAGDDDDDDEDDEDEPRASRGRPYGQLRGVTMQVLGKARRPMTLQEIHERVSDLVDNPPQLETFRRSLWRYARAEAIVKTPDGRYQQGLVDEEVAAE